MSKVQDYFKDFPASERCFETVDGLIFHERGDAKFHADGLNDKEVTEHLAVKNVPAKKEVAEQKKEAKK